MTTVSPVYMPREWFSYLRYVAHPLSEPIGFTDYLSMLAKGL